jgi:effector-binding domain-containing protein
VTDVRFVDLVERPTAVVRERVRTSELAAFFGTAFGVVARVVTARGAQITGPPFGYYREMPQEWVDVEAGFPVAAPIEPLGRVVPGTLPAGRAAEATHVGPYAALPVTYGAVATAIAATGQQPAAGLWEFYLSDPQREPDPATWRTTVVWPVA